MEAEVICCDQINVAVLFPFYGTVFVVNASQMLLRIMHKSNANWKT